MKSLVFATILITASAAFGSTPESASVLKFQTSQLASVTALALARIGSDEGIADVYSRAEKFPHLLISYTFTPDTCVGIDMTGVTLMKKAESATQTTYDLIETWTSLTTQTVCTANAPFPVTRKVLLPLSPGMGREKEKVMRIRFNARSFRGPIQMTPAGESFICLQNQSSGAAPVYSATTCN